MKADPFAQLRLLELQALDTTLAQLAHRRRTLPDLAALATIDERLAALRDEVVRGETEVGDLDREQRKAENDVDLVRTRIDRDNKRLASGQGSAKELVDTQHELASLARRQGDLEEVVLEVMERREAADTVLTALVEERDRLTAERAEVSGRLEQEQARIDGETAARRAERDAAVPELPADLVALYEKIRADQGGVGAAALHQRRCEGCRLELAGNDVNALRVAPPDEVVRCEECRRILIRTAESGL